MCAMKSLHVVYADHSNVAMLLLYQIQSNELTLCLFVSPADYLCKQF